MRMYIFDSKSIIIIIYRTGDFYIRINYNHIKNFNLYISLPNNN